MAITINNVEDVALGNMRGKVFKITGDNSVQYFKTGLKHIVYATHTGDAADPAMRLVFNSNNGTYGTEDGSLFANTAWTAAVYRVFVIGW